MTKKTSTGLVDRNLKMIYEGDIIRVGMRRGHSGGWSTERVVRKRSRLLSLLIRESWSEWCLVNDRGERMDMQLDQELREKIDE